MRTFCNSVGVLLVRNAALEFRLLALQIGLGELIDRLVQERRAAHGGLDDRELQDVVGGLVLEQFLERVFDQATRQHLRRVVAGALLPVAPGQAVDEGIARIDAKLLAALLVSVMDSFAGLVLVDAAGGNEPGAIHAHR